MVKTDTTIAFLQYMQTWPVFSFIVSREARFYRQQHTEIQMLQHSIHREQQAAAERENVRTGTIIPNWDWISLTTGQSENTVKLQMSLKATNNPTTWGMAGGNPRDVELLGRKQISIQMETQQWQHVFRYIYQLRQRGDGWYCFHLANRCVCVITVKCGGSYY